MKTKALFCLLILFLFSNQSRSQLLSGGICDKSVISKCDYCLASQGVSPTDAGSSAVRYDFRYLRDQDLFQDGKRIDNLSGDMETYITHQVSLYLKINDRFSASLLVPFSSRSESGKGTPPRVIDTVKTHGNSGQQAQHHVEDHPFSNYQSGLSDIMVIGRYKILGDVDCSVLLSVIGGAMLPTGTTNAKDNAGEFLNPHMQLGTGAVVPLIGISAQYGIDDFSLSSGVLAAFPGVGAREYQFGKNVNYDLTSHYNLLKPGDFSSLFVSLGVIGEWHGQEKNNGVEVLNTGGNTTYLSPGLQYLFDEHISFEASYQYPFIHALNGKQLGETYRFTAGAQYLF